MHPRFRTLTTDFLSEDLVSGPQRRVFFLETSFQVHLKVWTGYWESRFRSFIKDSDHLSSGLWRFWRPRSFQDLVLFLSPQTDGQTDTMFAFIYKIAHWGNNNYHHKLQLGEQISSSWLWHGDPLSWYSTLVWQLPILLSNIALLPRFNTTSLKSDVKFVKLIMCLWRSLQTHISLHLQLWMKEPSMLNTTKLSGHQEFAWHFFALDFTLTEGSSSWHSKQEKHVKTMLHDLGMVHILTCSLLY